VHVAALDAVKEGELAAGLAGAADVRDDVHVAARDEEVGRARFDEPHRSADVLDLAGVARGGDQCREAPVGVRGMDVGQQVGAVAHGNDHVVEPLNPGTRLGELAVLAPSGLRPVEPTLPDPR
jgi:hypothetical protein